MMDKSSENTLYSIGKVSELTGLRQSVLRYWETVFPLLSPFKTAGGTRKYSQQDVRLLKKIKTLLYDHKFTIAGANHFLNQGLEIKSETDSTIGPSHNNLHEIADEIEAIISELNK